MKNLKDYIIVLENILDDALCQDILSEYKDCSDWRLAEIASGINEDIRNVSLIPMSYPEIISINQEARKNLDNSIFNSVSKAINKYNEKFNHCTIENDTGYDLLRYNTGQFYKQHTDSNKINPRAVSCSLALNDDYEGGEFGFFDRELVIRAPKGGAVLFPSNFMYPHEILPVTKGTRYSIITWFI